MFLPSKTLTNFPEVSSCITKFSKCSSLIIMTTPETLVEWGAGEKEEH